MIKAVVIDDESSNRSLITKLVLRLNSNFDIVGEAKDAISGYDLIKEVKPQLVFLDIKMASGSGFDLLEMFKEINFEVVFISGFDNYALKAFEFNALDYVLKPINPYKFARTLEKVNSRIVNKFNKPEVLRNVVKSFDVKKSIISRISIHVGNAVIFLDIEDIQVIMSEDGCTFFKTKTGEKYFSSKELSDFSFILEQYSYILRVNRSTYINLKYLNSYTKGTVCHLTLNDGAVIEVSRRKKSEIRAILERKNEV